MKTLEEQNLLVQDGFPDGFQTPLRHVNVLPEGSQFNL